MAYFCMQFGIHQPRKTYAGGLGFLAGSHMQSAYELQQNIVGIGILWKYGYYDQVRKQDRTMDTSGMSAAMNGAVNVSISDGWFPEFAKDKINSFIIPLPDHNLPVHQQDEADANSLYDLLEQEILPMYYDNPAGWLTIVKNGMKNIIPQFDSKRMAQEYYEKLYS